MFQVIDQSLFELINISAHNAVFNYIMPFFSQAWIMWLGAILCVITFAIHCWRSSLEPIGRVLMLILLMGLSCGLTDISTGMLKHSIGRERPCQEIIGTNYYDSAVKQWVVVENEAMAEEISLGGSMPSSPAAACMAVAVVLSLLFYRSNPWVYFLPLSVGFSQIYVGKNYPFDVAVGWLIGLLSVIAVWWVCHMIFVRFSSQRRLHEGVRQKK